MPSLRFFVYLFYSLYILGCGIFLLVKQLRRNSDERHPVIWVGVMYMTLASISIFHWAMAFNHPVVTDNTRAYLTCVDMACMLLLPLMGDLLIKRRGFWYKLIISEMLALTLVVAYWITKDLVLINYTLFLYIVYFWCMYIWQVRQVKQYQQHLKDAVSDMTDIRLSWFSYIMGFMGVAASVWVGSYASHWENLDAWVYISYVIIMTASITGLTFFINRTPVSRNPVVEDDNDSAKKIMERHPEWDKKMLALVKEQEIWKDPNIRVDDMAQMMGTNRTYLYQYLRDVCDTTFYDMVNRYRLEYAVSLLNSQASALTMEQIAEMSGFKSIRSFRAVFTEKYGYTPAEYVSRIKSRQ